MNGVPTPLPLSGGRSSYASFEQVMRGIDAALEDVTVAVELPTDPSWLALPETLELASCWHVELSARVGDGRAAAMWVAGWIVEVPALLVAVPVVFGAPVPDLETEDLHVRRHPDGWFGEMAVDPMGVEPDTGDRLAAAGAMVHRLSAPLVEQLCARLPVGPVSVWGTLADSLGSYVLDLAYSLGEDPATAWERAIRLLHALDRCIDVRLRQPSPLLVAWTGGVHRHQTRGTCCLYHRTCASPVDEDGSCTTCPLRSHDSRIERLVAWLERSARRVESTS
jgi:hypothetical protein